MGPWDYVILISVVLLIGLAVFIMLRRKKAGKGSCGECSCCSGCPGASNCVKKEETPRDN